MRIMVLGAGAIGLWLGVNLVRAGHTVSFVGRTRFVEAARRDGVRVAAPGGDGWRVDQAALAAGAAEAARDGTFGAVCLCVKAYDVDAACAELRESGALAAATGVVCMQNGIGAEERCADALGRARTIAGTLTSPISLEGPAAVRLERARGGVGLAPLAAGSESGEIARAFEAAPLLNVRRYDDYRSMKWSKLLLNLVGNASSAIHGLPVAAVYADARLAKIEMDMLREAVRVMDGLGLAAVDLPGAPVTWLARAIRLLPDALLREVLRRNFAKARGDKRPSLYYDVARGAEQSEVTYLNGAVVEAGRALGIPTPVNTALTEQVLQALQRARSQSA